MCKELCKRTVPSQPTQASKEICKEAERSPLAHSVHVETQHEQRRKSRTIPHAQEGDENYEEAERVHPRSPSMWTSKSIHVDTQWRAAL